MEPKSFCHAVIFPQLVNRPIAVRMARIPQVSFLRLSNVAFLHTAEPVQAEWAYSECQFEIDK